MTDELPLRCAAGRWLIVGGYGVPQDARQRIARRLAPRIEALELARLAPAETVSQRAGFGRGLGRLGLKAAQIASSVQAFARRGGFDAIYTTGEDISIWLAPMLRLSGWKGLLITVVHNCGSSASRRLMRLVPRTPNDRFVCFCRSQERLLVEELGVPRASVCRVTNPVDYEFFSPSPAAQADCVFSAGRERRDYDTLAAAAAGLPMPVRISTSGFLERAEGPRNAPANVSVLPERVSYGRIKALYDSARIVVAPLHPSTYAAGVNGILEAMAMAKPVVVTRSPGLEDYVRGGEIGRVVAPGDPAAMRRAIEELWSRPELCAEIGRRNREWVERNAAIEGYCDRVLELGEAHRSALRPLSARGKVGERFANAR